MFRKIHGVTDDYVAIENLPAGPQINIAVTAGNMGGESQLSQAVTITTPA